MRISVDLDEQDVTLAITRFLESQGHKVISVYLFSAGPGDRGELPKIEARVEVDGFPLKTTKVNPS